MSATNLTVSAPKIEDRPFKSPLLCGPGPCDIWPSVKEALSRPILSPLCDETFNVLDDIRAGLQYVFQTQSKMVLAISGSGHSGMETVISNLVGPNETLLIASRGIWDERALGIAKRYGIKTELYKVPMDTTFRLEDIEVYLKKIRPIALFITHGDSSTGTVQKIEGLGALCHKYGALLLVDTVVSLVGVPFFMDAWEMDGVYTSSQKALSGPAGITPVAFSERAQYGALLLVDTVVSLVGVPFFMDAWEVDGVYTSSQKALSGPAGITPVAFSERAQKKIENRNFEPPFYFDMKLLCEQWNCFGNTRKYHHTMSPPLLWALRCCLQEIVKETLPKSWERHAANTLHFYSRMQQLSLEFLIPKHEDRLVTVTTIVLPKGYDYIEFVAFLRKNHNILIFPGLGPTAGKSLRIGIMGVNSTLTIVNAIADSMSDALTTLKKSSL